MSTCRHAVLNARMRRATQPSRGTGTLLAGRSRDLLEPKRRGMADDSAVGSKTCRSRLRHLWEFSRDPAASRSER